MFISIEKVSAGKTVVLTFRWPEIRVKLLHITTAEFEWQSENYSSDTTATTTTTTMESEKVNTNLNQNVTLENQIN